MLTLYADGTVWSDSPFVTWMEENRECAADYSGYGMFAMECAGKQGRESGGSFTITELLQKGSPTDPVKWYGSGYTQREEFGGDYSIAAVTHSGFTQEELLEVLT